jgi:hypothetical protein
LCRKNGKLSASIGGLVLKGDLSLMRQLLKTNAFRGIVGIRTQAENHFSLGSDLGKFSSDWTGGQNSSSRD